MPKYGLHNKLTAKEGNAEQLAAILIQASELVSKAPGCQLYSVATDPTLPNTVWVSEIWDTKDDHGNSLKMDGVMPLITQAMPLLAAMPEKGQELEVLGGHGVG